MHRGQRGGMEGGRTSAAPTPGLYWLGTRSHSRMRVDRWSQADRLHCMYVTATCSPHAPMHGTPPMQALLNSDRIEFGVGYVGLLEVQYAEISYEVRCRR